MSLGKLPGIKGLVAGSQGKRRFKSDLSVDMISPPLADFRHTMHVGRGGDVFGDTSFLSNHGGNREPGSPDSTTSGSKTTRFLSRTLRHVRKTPAPCPRGGPRDLSPPPPPVSPIIKNAISLPHLNLDPPNGCLQRVLFPSSASSPADSLYSYGLQSGFVTLPRLSRLDRQLQEGDFRRGSLPDNDDFSLPRSDSFTSFTVDLGPSLMSEVLGLIDNSSCLQMTNHSWAEEDEEEEEEEEPSEVFEPVVDSPVLSSASPSVGCTPVRVRANHRGRSCSSERPLEEEEDGMSPKTPDASMGSPVRVEPTMEAERFQKAADVLARHYGGGSFTRGRSQSQEGFRSDSASSPLSLRGDKALYAFPDEEEEIKV